MIDKADMCMYTSKTASLKKKYVYFDFLPVGIPA